MTTADRWNPTQYNLFEDQRSQPFHDLAALVQPAGVRSLIDLGCGTGALTATLADRFPDATILGVDSSRNMLDQAAAFAGERVRFAPADVGELTDYSPYDVVFSNAALQWVPDNEAIMARILTTLPPGAQVAIQVPKNDNHPSHALAVELAQASPFKEQLNGFVRWSHALAMERYATLLYEHGFREHLCFEKVYGHELGESADVIEWVKGTSLNAYLSRLDAPDAAAFLATYRERLLATIGEHAPYFYPFRRLLMWGRKGS